MTAAGNHSVLKKFFAQKMSHPNFKIALHLILVSAPIGFLVGAAIAGYDYVVNTFLWENFTLNFAPEWLCVLPLVGMLLTGIILKIFGVPSSAMADEIVQAYHNPEQGLNYKRVLPKLSASVATMGFGCSAGMEGACKWLGGAISAFSQSILNRFPILKPWHGRVEITMLAGAAAGISAIFRAPLTGAIMGIESPYKKDLAHEALLHGLVASAISYVTFVFLRNATPYFPIKFSYTINLRDLIYCVFVGILAGLFSHLFLWVLSLCKKMSAATKHIFLLHHAIGGILLSLIAYGMLGFLGEATTLHSGLAVSNILLAGGYSAQMCIALLFMKLFATAITFGMGGVGGFFVPSATIGAALGAVCDIYFHPSQPGLFTLIGIAAFTGASYNSLLFSAVFIAEASGNPALVVPGLIASSIAYLVSAGVSNSPSQRWRRTDVFNVTPPENIPLKVNSIV